METSINLLFLGYYMLLTASVGLALVSVKLFHRHKELERMHKRLVKLLMARTRKV